MAIVEGKKLKIGDPAPDFPALPGVDGVRRGLADFAKSPVLIIVFSCNHCPYVVAYEDRLMAIQSEFGPRGAQIVAINSNDADKYPDDSFDNMVRRAAERKFNFVYLRDDSQSVARAFGATNTPHLFVFDRDRKLRYTGKIDDNWQEPQKVTRRFLHDAVAALLDGKAPPEAETFAIGCTIKWKS